MKWSLENIQQTMIPILVINWLVGFGTVEYPTGNSRTKFSFIFVLFIALGLWFDSVTRILGPCSDTNVNSLDFLVFSVNKCLNTITASASLIIGWLSRKVS